MKIRPVGLGVVPDRHDKANSRGFANAPKNYSKSYENQLLSDWQRKYWPRRDSKDEALVRRVVVNESRSAH
jgi:hypothetical protein